MRARGSRLVALLAMVLGLVAAACGGGAQACERIDGVRAGVCITPPAERAAAPDLRMDLLGEDGTAAIPDFVGDVVVVNFWASWCGPCRSEQPGLNIAAEQLAASGVSFLGVNLLDSPTNAEAHVREFEIPYPSLVDADARYASNFRGVGPSTIPSTVLIDRQGRVAVRLIGETTAGEVIALASVLAAE